MFMGIHLSMFIRTIKNNYKITTGFRSHLGQFHTSIFPVDRVNQLGPVFSLCELGSKTLIGLCICSVLFKCQSTVFWRHCGSCSLFDTHISIFYSMQAEKHFFTASLEWEYRLNVNDNCGTQITSATDYITSWCWDTTSVNRFPWVWHISKPWHTPVSFYI